MFPDSKEATNVQMILRSSKTVALILIGSMSVLWGFKSCVDNAYYDRSYGSSSTQPTGSRSHGFWWGRSGSSYRSGGSSVSHSGTSRGGFGSSGHAAGS